MIRLKNETQIAGIRRSCRLLADMFASVLPQVRAGISTKDIDDLCRRFIKSHGGKPAWYREDFPGAACVSVNDEVIHGVPSRRRVLHDGDIVSIDVGIDLDGYISDSTHTVMIGDVSPEVRRLVEVTKESLYAGIAAAKAGNRVSDIAKAVTKVAGGAGYGIVYDYCGHGVGLDVHEDPSVPNNADFSGANPRLQSGMVIAIEPMINLGVPDVFVGEDDWTVLTKDGRPSCHWEHTVAIFADRTEVLTALDGDAS